MTSIGNNSVILSFILKNNKLKIEKLNLEDNLRNTFILNR
jgi:hypothetical protein